MHLHSHVLEYDIRFFVLSMCVCGQWSEARRVEYECDRLSYRLNVVTAHSVHVPLPCCGSLDITAGQLHTCQPCPINEHSHSGEIRLHSHWHVGFILDSSLFSPAPHTSWACVPGRLRLAQPGHVLLLGHLPLSLSPCCRGEGAECDGGRSTP